MNARVLTLLFFAVTTGLLSCKDKDLPPAASVTTPVTVLNATSDTIKFYVNGTRQNNTSPIFIGGSTGYIAVTAGLQNYKFSQSNEGFPVLFTTTFKLDTPNFYSIFVAGTTADKAFLTIDQLGFAASVLAADTPASIHSMIRIVNASPDAGSLDIMVGKGDTVNLKNCPFKFVSPFTKFTAGLKEVKVYQSGVPTPKIDTMITFQTSEIYTLFTKGQLNGKGGAVFSVSVVSNE